MPVAVSICLPNLNNRKYLERRLDSIYAQSFTDWELIVVDSFSNDGSWEYFQQRLSKEPRAQLFQTPPGLYDAWNFAIQQAKGDYIYFATADDTFDPNFLEKTVEVLQKNPDCDLAECNLRVLDESGHEIPDFYAQNSKAGKYYKERLQVAHLRKAPHDGLLHYYGGTVYISITQLLIRKSVFDSHGLYRTDLGPQADFEWGMRIGMKCKVYHIPEYLADWTIHNEQVTSLSATETADAYIKLKSMSRLVELPENFNLRRSEWERGFMLSAMSLELANAPSMLSKLSVLLGWFWKSPRDCIYYIALKLRKQKFQTEDYIRALIQRTGLHDSIESI